MNSQSPSSPHTSTSSNQQIKPISPGRIFAWTIFDFAHTGFSVVIITLVYPIYFRNVIAGGNEAYWGRTISASMLITALIGPLLGAIADASNRKKLFLGFFTAACVLATAGLYFTGEGTLWPAVVLLIIANVGYEGGTIFYDAFLPEITSQKNYGRVSGYGFAMGYLGSFAILLLVLPFLEVHHSIQSEVRGTFLIAAAFFGVFSIPLFLFVKEHRLVQAIEKNFLTAGYSRLRDTFVHINQYDPVKRFLLAFFVYNDSILTVIFFSGIFAEHSLGLSLSELVYFFLLVQGSALLGSVLFGIITNRIGARQAIIITLLIWIAVVLGVFFTTTKEAFFILGFIAGTALGSSQSSSRTMMALLTPQEKKTEFFGFYDGFFGKASAVVGPLIFGEVASRAGQRPAILIVAGMIVIGLLLLLRTPDVRPRLHESVGSSLGGGE